MEASGDKKSARISLDLSSLLFDTVSKLVQALILTYYEIFQALAVEGVALLPKPLLDTTAPTVRPRLGPLGLSCLWKTEKMSPRPAVSIWRHRHSRGSEAISGPEQVSYSIVFSVLTVLLALWYGPWWRYAYLQQIVIIIVSSLHGVGSNACSGFQSRAFLPVHVAGFSFRSLYTSKPFALVFKNSVVLRKYLKVIGETSLPWTGSSVSHSPRSWSCRPLPR